MQLHHGEGHIGHNGFKFNSPSYNTTFTGVAVAVAGGVAVTCSTDTHTRLESERSASSQSFAQITH